MTIGVVLITLFGVYMGLGLGTGLYECWKDGHLSEIKNEFKEWLASKYKKNENKPFPHSTNDIPYHSWNGDDDYLVK